MKSFVSRFLEKCRAHRRGQSMILFAAVMPVLVGICGLSIDAGNLYLQRRALQSIADAAAMAGAQNANFDRTEPAILPAGVETAIKAAKANGAVVGGTRITNPPVVKEGEVEVRLPADKTLYPNILLEGKFYEDAHIQVVVTRTVSNPFMSLFGLGTVQVKAWSVARCFMPGFGDAAILALSSSPTAIKFGGGGSAADTDNVALSVTGELVSYGGIDAAGNASKFQVTGSAYSYGAEAETNMTFVTETNDPNDPNDDELNGAYGSTQSSQIPKIYDPVTQGIASNTFFWPHNDDMYGGPGELAGHPYGWTYGPQLFEYDVINPLGILTGVVKKNPLGAGASVWCDSGSQCGDFNFAAGGGGGVSPGTESIERCNNASDRIDIGNNEADAIFYPGTYICEVRINSGNVVFWPGMYIFKKSLLIQGGNVTSYIPIDPLTGQQDPSKESGVLFRLEAGVAVDMSGGTANLTLFPYRFNSTTNNTWKNIIFYAVEGDVDITGSGDKSINGSIYAPYGNVKIAGNGPSASATDGATIQNGQIIAETVEFFGNGPAVYFNSDEADATFGPVLLNKPD